MIITETILRNFRDKLINEEIHLPHGTKSAKVVLHVDLDGLISGISYVQALVKQGIPKNRITIEFAQYGDEKKDKNFAERFQPKNKSQYVGVVDFAKLPKVKPFDIFNKLTSFKGSPDTLKGLMQKDYTNMNLQDFETFLRKRVSIVDNKFTKQSIKDLFNALKAYSLMDNKPSLNNIKALEYPLVTPEFLSDHHSNETNALSPGKHGELAVKSPSEGEYFANKYIPGIWSQEDLKAVSMVDSAGYTEDQLKNTIFLEKHFTGPDKKKNLATLICTVYDNMVKKDPEAAKYVVLNAGPNLVSVYSTCLKAAKITGKRLEVLNLLKNGKTTEAKQIIDTLPPMFSKKWWDMDTYKNVKPVMGVEEWRKKNNTDLENAKTGYKTEKDDKTLEDIKGKRGEEFKNTRDEIKSKKGKLAQYNNFTMFNGKDKKTQYSRYMSSLYSVNGQRTPFTLRYWDGFFQVAKNTLYKGFVDFSKVQEIVLKDIEDYLLDNGLNKMKVNGIIENMKHENGGHSTGIWSFQGFDQIKPTSKEIGSYWDKKDMVSRADKVGAKVENARSYVKNIDDTVNAKYKKIKEGCMKMAMASVMKNVNKLYPPSKEDLLALKTNDKSFEGK